MFVNTTIELVVKFIICFYGLQFAISYHSFKGVRVMMFNTTFQQYFSYIVPTSFIDEGNWRKP